MRSAARLRAIHHVSGGDGASKTPDQVTGLWGWWNPVSLPAGADGTAIGQWNDASGNARHLLQATAGNKPLKKTGIVNGLDVARFDGADDYLAISGITSPGEANPSDLSIFVIAKATDQGSNHTPISTRDGGANGWLFRYSTTGLLFGHLGQGTNVTSTATTTAWHLSEMIRTALSTVLGFNGTMQAPSSNITGYPGTTSQVNVGIEDTAGPGGSVSISAPFLGDIAEIALYTTPVGTSDRDALEVGWATKYGITIA